MAIYNPKRARELEAAARLAESQRQRELAKGQREQRATEQILGLVEGLIGAAPQVVGGLQDVQAQQVLAGEKPLPEQKPKSDDILENIGRFITDPFDAGVRQRVKQMAAERAPAEVAKLQPLTSKAVKERIAAGPRPLDAPSERKELSKEQFEERVVQAMPVEATARYVLDESPVLQLLPERERQALAAGETQRVQAEQAAAERQAKMDEAEIALMKAKEKNLLTKKEISSQKVNPGKIKDIANALVGAVRADAQTLKETLNSSDDNLRAEAYDKLDELVDAKISSMVDADGNPVDPNSIIAMSARAEVQKQLAKELELEPLTETALEKLQSDKDTIEKLANLVERRSEVGFTAKNRQIIAAKLAEAVPSLLYVDRTMKELNKLGFEGELTPAQKSWFQDAMIMKQRLTTAEFKGTGAISDAERRSIISYVLDPMSTDADFDQRAYDTIADISKKFAGKVNMYRGVNKRMPADWIKFADNLDKTIGEGSEQLVIDILSNKPKSAGVPSLDVSGSELLTGAATLLETPGKMISEGGPDVFKYLQSLISSGDPETAAAASTALGQLRNLLPQQQPAAAPQTSQQQVQQMQPAQEVEETAYARLKQEGKLGPGMEMFIITNQQGKVSYVTAEDTEEGIRKLESAVSKKAPGSTIQKYTGNLAGGK
jgi:hypothetical protein